MAEGEDYLRQMLAQAADEEAFLDRLTRADGSSAVSREASAAVSLMITQRQRQQLRERGFSDDEIRVMTPNEAHAHLDLPRS